MKRSVSTGNRIINKRVVESNYDKHLMRLEKIKTSISQTSLLQKEKDQLIKETMALKKTNPKKEVQKEFYYSKVEKENKLLLDRISNIVYNKASKNGDQPQSFRIKSLNEVVKKKEINTIMNQNMGIVHRIQNQTSVYNVKLWEKDFMKKAEYLRNISEFKVFRGTKADGLRSPKRSASSGRGAMRRSSSVADFKEHAERLSSATTLDDESPASTITHKKSKTGKRLVLFKKILKIEANVYSVEVSIFEKKLQINLVNNKSSEPFIISYNEDITRKLLEEYKNNYNEIVAKVGFKDGKAYLNWTPKTPEVFKIELFEPILHNDEPISSPIKEDSLLKEIVDNSQKNRTDIPINEKIVDDDKEEKVESSQNANENIEKKQEA